MQAFYTLTLLAITVVALVPANNKQHVLVEHPDGYIVVDSFDPEFCSPNNNVSGGKDRRTIILNNNLPKKPAFSQQQQLSVTKPVKKEDDPFASFKPKEDSISGPVSQQPAKTEYPSNSPVSTAKKPRSIAEQGNQLESLFNAIFGLDMQTGYPAEANRTRTAPTKASGVGSRFRQAASNGVSRIASKIPKKESGKEDPIVFDDIQDSSSFISSNDIGGLAISEDIFAEELNHEILKMLEEFGDTAVNAIAELFKDMIKSFNETLRYGNNSEDNSYQSSKKGHGKKNRVKKQLTHSNKNPVDEDLLMWLGQVF